MKKLLKVLKVSAIVLAFPITLPVMLARQVWKDFGLDKPMSEELDDNDEAE